VLMSSIGTLIAHPMILRSCHTVCAFTPPLMPHLSAAARPCPNVHLRIPTVSSDGEPLLLTLPIDATVRARGVSRNSAGSPTVASLCSTPAPTPPPVSTNVFDMLDRDDDGAEYDSEHACAWTEADLQTSHEAWAHPGHSKFDSIITHYPDLFPRDKTYRARARHLRCPVCDLMKGARHYRKSKRMKVKAARDSARKHKQAAHASILRSSSAPEPDTAVHVAQQGGASVCTDHAAPRRVRFAPDTVEHCKLPKDDFLRAYQTSTPLSRLSCYKAQHDLHVDYAHSISIGYKNEAYYLVMVIDRVDFLWAAPTAHKSNPESLLESFPILQNLQLLALEGPRTSLGDAGRPPLQPEPAQGPVDADGVDVVV